MAPETGLLLHAITRIIAPRTAVEIGSFRGVSAIWMGAAISQQSTLHCIDPFGPAERGTPLDELRRCGRQARVRLDLGAAGLRRCTRVHRGDSASILERLRSRGELRAVDLVYIDGDHTFQGVLRDVGALSSLLNERSPLILHDVFPDRSACDGPRQFLDRRAEFLPRSFAACDLYTAPANFGISVLHPVPMVYEPHPETDPRAEQLFLFAMLLNARPRTVEIHGQCEPADLEIIASAAAAIHARNHHDHTLITRANHGPIAARPRDIGWLRTGDLSPPPPPATPAATPDIIIARAPVHEAPHLVKQLSPGGYLVLLGQMQCSPETLPAQHCRLGNILIVRRTLSDEPALTPPRAAPRSVPSHPRA